MTPNELDPEALERLERATEPMFCNVSVQLKEDICALLRSYRTLQSEHRIAMRDQEFERMKSACNELAFKKHIAV